MKILLLFCFLLIVSVNVFSEKNIEVKQYWGNEPKDINVWSWKPLKVDTNGIVVTWSEKYGATKTVTCIGIWENATQYLLTFKSSRKIPIEKANTNDLDY